MTYKNFTLDIDADGVALVTWDMPGRSMNVFTLEVMDDYNIVIPMKMGYFKKLGIQAKLFPGDATGNLPQIAAGQYDMGYASPGVLTASLDAGVPVVSIWSQIPGQVFDFVLPADSKITHPRQLKGKTISIHNAGWIPIVNPMLAEVGVDPKTVKYREFGGGWVALEVEQLVNGRRRLLEEYTQVRTNVALPEGIFDARQWSSTPHWARQRGN